MENVLTLSLTQPWATLVAIGAKKIETRSWTTAYRGRLAIHAAKGLGPVGGKRGLGELCSTEPFCSVLQACPFEGLPFGCIVATCTLVDVRRIYTGTYGLNPATLTDQERAFGDYTPGRYAWLLADVQMLPEPVPAKGALGLWKWEGATS